MRTGRIIHLLQGKWTQALKQFRGRRVSKCDHFVTCQEERAGPSRGGHKGVGLSDMTVSVHPFRLGEEEGGRGRIQLKPQGCYHPSEKETHPEARKDCEHINTQFLQGAWGKLPKKIALCRCVKFTC